MKKTLTLVTLLAGAVTGYSQGIVTLQDYAGPLDVQIFGVQTSAPANGTATPVTWGTGENTSISEYVGSTAATSEIPQGTTVYAAGTALSGTGFDADLLIGAGSGDAISALAPAGTAVNHFYTTAVALGYIKGASTYTVTGINGAVTVAIAAWQNTGVDGAATTLAAAQADGYAWGISLPENMTINGTTPTVIPSTGIESFSLGTPVPEPSTIALGVMGVSALLFRRRK
jgi:hypothetical protein